MRVARAIYGLRRALFYAGARSLLVSLWDVNDASTAVFMRRFYELMRKLMQASLKAGLMVNILVNSTLLLIALGNAIAPHNLIAAAAIVALAGRENEILRRTLPVVIPLVIAAGAVAYVLVNL